MKGHFAVLAELPLGYFRGHGADGSLDEVPAPARLHSALLAAAGQGVRAVASAGALGPSVEDLELLTWLETNPPDGVVIPSLKRIPFGDLIAYRSEGTIRKEGAAKAPSAKTAQTRPVGSVAVGGKFGWTWSQPPPPEHQNSLAELVQDVSHLGTAESPVRLWVDKATPTHRLSRNARLFRSSPGAHDLDTTVAGRTQALITAHSASLRPPTQSRFDDWRPSADEPVSTPVEGKGRTLARFIPDVPAIGHAIWDVIHHRPLRGPAVQDDQRLPVAVAVHRGMVRILDQGAPAVVTGAYPEGVARPANRVAIQVLPRDQAALAGLDQGHDHLLLMIPHGCPLAEAEAARAAFAELTWIATSTGRWTLSQAARSRAGSSFWAPPAQDATRFWRISPAALPDIRPVRGGDWDLGQVVALSVALLARDHRDPSTGEPVMGLDTTARSEQRYRQWSQAAQDAGVRLLDSEFLRISDVRPYVHRSPEKGVVRPYRATLTLGAWAGPQWLLALGQTRHLGGGLLVPFDVPSHILMGEKE